jgi:hypothetical protein
MASKKKNKKVKIKTLFRFDREINTIIQHIEPRINEVCAKFADGVYNEATMFAFWVGLGGDLDEALTKIQKRKNRR